jgi:TRAP-type C4-dicarboxylate transport system substrate-binding protein
VSNAVRRAFLIAALLGLLAALPVAGRSASAAEQPVRLKIIGGLADVSQYVRFEEPFWRQRITELTQGRVQAEIAPFDRSGIRAGEMLRLLRLGVVSFGTTVLSVAAAEEPEFNAVDLPALSPDLATLRRTVSAFRPRLEALLRERYGVKLLGIYTYPAQVLFCSRGFTGLGDLAGRRVRTSSVSQSELMEALGAVPVVTPFAEIMNAFRTGQVECAITGTLSGNAIGLHQVTTHVHAMALTWGISIFAANLANWAALPPELRDQIRAGVRELEAEIWRAAERETGEGLACNAGQPHCPPGTRRGSMTIVPVSAADEESRRRLLTGTVLPRWIGRCGQDCVEAWNRHLAPVFGVQARLD